MKKFKIQFENDNGTLINIKESNYPFTRNFIIRNWYSIVESYNEKHKDRILVYKTLEMTCKEEKFEEICKELRFKGRILTFRYDGRTLMRLEVEKPKKEDENV